MNDESKAVEEVAKTTGKAIDATREFGGFVATYAGHSLEQAMGLVEDKFRYMRWERQMRLVERAAAFLKERGLPAPSRTVPLQVMIPLIQAGSIEAVDVGTEMEDEIWTKHIPKFVSKERPEGDIRPSAEVEVSLGNLARLGLVASAMFWSGPSPFSCVNKTALGLAFLKGVSRGPVISSDT